MTKAPERIWVDDERPIGGQVHVWDKMEGPGLAYCTEFLRADLALAAEAAALERAAQRAHDDAGRFDTPDRIRALITSKQQSALDAYVAEKVAAETRRCAAIAEKEARNFAYTMGGILDAEPGSPHDRGREECGNAIAAAITEGRDDV